MKRISANKRMEQWKLLLHQTNHSPPAPAPAPPVTTQIQQRQEEEQGDTDPFDCRELIIPDTKGLVRSSLERKLREWQELDSRIIVEDIVPSAKGFKPGYQNRRKRLNSDSDSEQDKGDSDDNGNDNDNYDDNNNDDDDDDDGETSVVIVTAPAAGDYGGVQWGFHANRIRLPDFLTTPRKDHLRPNLISKRDNINLGDDKAFHCKTLHKGSITKVSCGKYSIKSLLKLR